MKTNGIIGRISRIREQVNLRIEKELRDTNIDGILPAHGSILNFLFRQDQPVAIKEVVKQVGRVKSTVTGMINTLVQHGYVQKSQSEEDRRVFFVSLTEKGITLKPHFDSISCQLIDVVYRDMPEEDQQTLARLLDQMLKNIKGDE